ncbi:MAG: FAD-dependent oxidoreductase [Francisellaceae bacterium]
MKIAIIGAGVLGRLLAMTLLAPSEAEIKLSVYDRAPDLRGMGSSGLSAAGMVAPVCELLERNGELYRRGVISQGLWSDIDKRLGGGIYSVPGTVILAHYKDRAELDYAETMIKSFCPDTNEIKRSDIAGLNVFGINADKHLCRDYLSVAREGAIDVPAFFAASANWLLNHPAIDCRLSCDIKATDLEKLRRDYDWVIDCRGLGAKDSLAGLYGVRGEAIEVYAPEVDIKKIIRLCHPRHPLYIVPRANHHYYIGATVIHGEDGSAISVKSMMELLSGLSLIDSGFLEARVISTKTGLRPTLPSGMPSIIKNGRLIHINGLYRHGYLLTPAICQELVADIKEGAYDTN